VVRARWLLLTAALLTPLLSGCGGIASSDEPSPIGRRLAVYSSLPLHGPLAEEATQVLDGERLALADVRRRAGRFRIELISLDDTGPKGVWEPGVTATNARIADRDHRTIAYIGDYDSGATAVSLPANNLAGILQVSPMSPYVGLTSAFEAGEGDPERFYPTGRRNFVRLPPGDAVQAAAQVRLMRKLHVRSLYVLADGQPFGAPLPSIVASDAKLAGIDVKGEQSVELAGAGPQSRFASVVEQVTGSGAEAVFLGGEPGIGAAELWQQLHAAEKRLLLLAGSDMASPSFTAAIGSAAARTYITSPALPASSWPAAAAHVFTQLRQRYGLPPGAYALYGYAAMDLVLSAVKRARRHGDDRAAVIAAALALHDEDSVLGRYSVLGDGETTITRYGVDRVRAGAPVFWRELSVSDGAPYEQHVP
jgi:branched-chain amino acid transport system substrate-binding protein